MNYVNTVSDECKSFMRNELEYWRLFLYACLAFHWLRVCILAHKPAALTAIYFLIFCWYVSGLYL